MRRFATDFPEYASLANPKPASVAEVQAQLRNERRWFLDTRKFTQAPEETFIWVITKSDMRWVKSALGTKALNERVAALRCGLDAALWDDEGAAARCRDLVKVAPERDEFDNIRAETLPFNTDHADALYQALFGPIEEKHLLIVPSGPLTQLPFQVLITEQHFPAASGPVDFRRAAWLVRNHALTVLPSVSSLKALRQWQKPAMPAEL